MIDKTPRTDKLLKDSYWKYGDDDRNEAARLADFSRDLERELTALQSRLAVLEALIRAVPDDVACNDIDGQNWHDAANAALKGVKK